MAVSRWKALSIESLLYLRNINMKFFLRSAQQICSAVFPSNTLTSIVYVLRLFNRLPCSLKSTNISFKITNFSVPPSVAPGRDFPKQRNVHDIRSWFLSLRLKTPCISISPVCEREKKYSAVRNLNLIDFSEWIKMILLLQEDLNCRRGKFYSFFEYSSSSVERQLSVEREHLMKWTAID